MRLQGKFESAFLQRRVCEPSVPLRLYAEKDGIKPPMSKADNGKIIRRSATCTHMGCVVHWNTFEKCWDCPCHGSHFAPNGQVLNGPALKALAET